jgi:carbonic anhydrase/acetyltransferase-like protein (isoleucine patch superfamily)
MQFLSKSYEGFIMAIIQFEDRNPKVGSDSYVCDSAEVIGAVTIGNNCYIGFGARLRGDYGEIVVGSGSIIEDNCVIHARPNEKCVIGKRVTVGHGSILHNCIIHDSVVIGMGAIVSDYAEIGEWAVVGEGAVVPNNRKIHPGKVAVGVPAKEIADTSEEYKKLWNSYKDLYAELAKRYPDGLKRL